MLKIQIVKNSPLILTAFIARKDFPLCHVFDAMFPASLPGASKSDMNGGSPGMKTIFRFFTGRAKRDMAGAGIAVFRNGPAPGRINPKRKMVAFGKNLES